MELTITTVLILAAAYIAGVVTASAADFPRRWRNWRRPSVGAGAIADLREIAQDPVAEIPPTRVSPAFASDDEVTSRDRTIGILPIPPTRVAEAGLAAGGGVAALELYDRQPTVEPGDPILISRSAPSPWFVDADCEVLLHQVDKDLWVATKTGGSALVYLGNLLLGATALPITAQTSSLRVKDASSQHGSGRQSIIDLSAVAAAVSGRRLYLVQEHRDWSTESKQTFAATNALYDSVVAISLFAEHGLSDDQRTRLRRLLADSGTLFVPTPAVRYSISALLDMAGEICGQDEVEIAVAMVGTTIDSAVGTTIDSEIVFGSSDGVTWQQNEGRDQRELESSKVFSNSINIGEASLVDQSEIVVSLPNRRGAYTLVLSPSQVSRQLELDAGS